MWDTHICVKKNPERNEKHVGYNYIYMGGFSSANQRFVVETDLPWSNPHATNIYEFAR